MQTNIPAAEKLAGNPVEAAYQATALGHTAHATQQLSPPYILI
ncbi:hypothetical protein R3J36_07005 [Xylella fastidiosa subsp. multiplex]|jgi:hypothetical protein|nr:hypothetical protein [Xylella fastidiosa]ERI60326.1 hypothetical protein M233_04960 [Xylella fastidiosa subsp. multiplex Griffin-1]KAF0570587.1 hypothetical protein P305_02920 [Xylella fastidiosa subsp. fastidiosa Mus-1]WDF06228.1 hypothetical protein PT012_07000 [Xylella fastidiosa subsp. multiplex]